MGKTKRFLSWNVNHDFSVNYMYRLLGVRYMSNDVFNLWNRNFRIYLYEITKTDRKVVKFK